MTRLQEKPHIGELIQQIAGMALAPVGYRSEAVIISLQEVRFTALRKRHFGRELRAYFVMTIDNKEAYTSPSAGDTTDPLWKLGKPIECKAHPSSIVKFTALRDGKVRGTRILGEFEAPLYIFLAKFGEPHKLASDDSPDACMFIHMTADVDRDYLTHGLDAVANRLAEVQNPHGAVGVLGSVVDCIQMLTAFGQHLAHAHPILKVASVILAAVYKTLTAHTAVDEEIKTLAKAMRDLLSEAYRYRDSKQAEESIRDIILLVLEGASLIDRWSRTSFIMKPFNAPAFLDEVKACEDKLARLRATFEVVKNLCKLGEHVNHIGIRVDDGLGDVKSQVMGISAQLALITAFLTQTRSEDFRAMVKTGALQAYDQDIAIVPAIV